MPFYRSHLPGTGGGGTPSATVSDETSFGIAKAAGASTDYSRGDHTHGTPAAPSIPSGSGTVTDETTYGITPAAGIASTYSKGDHTHGTPSAPSIPSGSATVASETTFALSSSAGSAATYSKGDHTHGTPAAPAVIISANALRGITPVSTIFTTAPTTLSNTTDGDFSTVTGTGSKAVTGAGNYGRLSFDMGSTKTVLMGARLGLWSSANASYAFFESSDDGSTWRPQGTEDSVCYNNTAAEVVSDSNTAILTGRYVSIRFWVSGTATGNAKIYEVYAFPLAV